MSSENNTYNCTHGSNPSVSGLISISWRKVPLSLEWLLCSTEEVSVIIFWQLQPVLLEEWIGPFRNPIIQDLVGPNRNCIVCGEKSKKYKVFRLVTKLSALQDTRISQVERNWYFTSKVCYPLPVKYSNVKANQSARFFFFTASFFFADPLTQMTCREFFCREVGFDPSVLTCAG